MNTSRHHQQPPLPGAAKLCRCKLPPIHERQHPAALLCQLATEGTATQHHPTTTGSPETGAQAAGLQSTHAFPPMLPKKLQKSTSFWQMLRARMPPTQWLLHHSLCLPEWEGTVVTAPSVHRVGLVHTPLAATVGSTAQRVQEGRRCLLPGKAQWPSHLPPENLGRADKDLWRRETFTCFPLSVLSLRKEWLALFWFLKSQM